MRQRTQQLIDGVDQPAAKSTALVIGEDVEVRQVGEGDVVGDESGKPDLFVVRERGIIEAKAERAVDNLLQDVFLKGLRPVTEVLGEGVVDGVEG